MFQILKCCYAELKKGLKELPYAILGIIILSVILGAVGFCAAKILYQKQEVSRSTVAVVTNDTDDPYVAFGMNLLASMDSTSFTLDFKLMPEKEAMEAFEKRQISAILLLPDNLLGGIMSGANPPIRILFSAKDNLSAVFLTEMTRAGARILSCAQADIYAMEEIYYALGRQAELTNRVYDDVNIMNLNYVFNREKIFIADTSSLNNTSSVGIFYAASGILMILLFITTAFPAMLRRESRDFYQLLFSKNISSVQYLFARICSFTFLFFLIQVLFFFAASKIPALNAVESLFLRFRWSLLLFFLSNGVFLATYANFIFLLAKDVSSGILISYCISSIMAFCSGCILPTAFFPATLQKAVSLFPTYYMQRDFISMLEGKPLELNPVCLCYPALFFVLCVVLFEYRRRSNRL